MTFAIMTHTTYIKSHQNPQFKELLRLFKKARERKKKQLFVIEGIREMERALTHGYELQQLWMREKTNRKIPWNSKITFELQATLFDKVTQRGGSESYLGVFKMKNKRLTDLKLSSSAHVLVAEAPEKPGNIGALIRTAAGAGLDAVLIANSKTDLYSPPCIRNSMGGLFSIPVIQEDTETLIGFLKEKKFFIAAAALSDTSIAYTETNYQTPLALVVGTEAVGLSEAWLAAADVCVQIPMTPPIDSLNVSVAAGILVYHSRESKSFPRKLIP
ncbi:MAG: TrmH family RNA methyltransferase [Flavobacteriaceae bacterium]